MASNALKPKGVFGMIHMLSQSGEIRPDFEVAFIDSLQMLSSGFYLFITICPRYRVRIAEACAGILDWNCLFRASNT